MTIGDLVTSALTEIRVARAGDVVNGDDMAFGVAVLNRLLNLWNADRRRVYGDTFADYTLTPNLSPHTIGPGGTFVVTQRPVRLDAAALNVGGSPAAYTPITVREADWYARQSVPALTSSLPTDVYYDPAWPLGKLYFWPVPTTASSVRLWTRVLLASVAQADDFSLPPGYQAALELTLAEELGPAFGQTVAASTALRARQARATVFSDHDDTPRLVTADAGIPCSGGAGGRFNYRTRSTT